MTTSRISLLVLFFTALCLAWYAPPAAARELSVHTITVPLAPFDANGAFPITIETGSSTESGTLRLASDGTRGAVRGTLALPAGVLGVTGRARSSAGVFRLALIASGSGRRMRVRGRLQGVAIVGSCVEKRGKVKLCGRVRIDVRAAQPLDAHVLMELSTRASGRITTSGSVTVGDYRTGVAVRGRRAGQSLRVRVRGAGFRWTARGRLAGDAYIVSWRTRGFGARARGEGLRLTPLDTPEPDGNLTLSTEGSESKSATSAGLAAAISSEPRLMSWAYFTDPSERRWYIAQVANTGRKDVFSLMPIKPDWRAGWGTVALSAADIDVSSGIVRVDTNLDRDRSDRYYDVGYQEWVRDARILDDRRLIQGATVAVKWYFFEVPGAGWFIVNAPGYGTTTEVLRFGAKTVSYGLEYDWAPVTGLSATFETRGSRKVVTFRTSGSSGSGERPRWPMTGLITATTNSYASHNGTDIASRRSQAGDGHVHPIASGRIIQIDLVGSGANGKFVRIDHGGGWQSVYLHLSRVDATSGTVTTDTRIGLEGNSGNVQSVNGGDGTHLHVSFYFDANGNNRCDADEYELTPQGLVPWQSVVTRGELVPGWPSVPGLGR